MLTTRLAPTPSGYLHLGNVFSFALTAAIAEQEGAKVLLRIDDLDRSRADNKYIRDIFETLDFLDIHYHTGPRSLSEFEAEWSQTHRAPLYNAALEQLIEKNMVFACECSRSDVAANSTDGGYPGTCLHKNLPLDTPGNALRLITSNTEFIDIKQYKPGLLSEKLPATLGNFIVRKKDGLPAYQLSSLVDDMHFGVNLIVRGEDLWPSTLAQLYLAKQLGYKSFVEAEFYHHPLLKNSKGEKLSKSAGATSVNYLRRQGNSRADVFTAIVDKLSDKINIIENRLDMDN